VSAAFAHGLSIACGRSYPGDTPAMGAITRIRRMRMNAFARAVIEVSRSLTIFRSLVQLPYRHILPTASIYHSAEEHVNPPLEGATATSKFRSYPQMTRITRIGNT